VVPCSCLVWEQFLLWACRCRHCRPANALLRPGLFLTWVRDPAFEFSPCSQSQIFFFIWYFIPAEGFSAGFIAKNIAQNKKPYPNTLSHRKFLTTLGRKKTFERILRQEGRIDLMESFRPLPQQSVFGCSYRGKKRPRVGVLKRQIPCKPSTVAEMWKSRGGFVDSVRLCIS